MCWVSPWRASLGKKLARLHRSKTISRCSSTQPTTGSEDYYMLGFAMAGLARKKAGEVASLENHFAMFLNPTYRW